MLGIVFPSLQALEKGQKLIIWPITPRLALGGCGFGQDFLLQREVRLQGDLCGFDRFMPEPQGDDGKIYPRLSEFHGHRVAQDMRRHPLLLERGACLTGHRGMLRQDVLHPVCTEASTTGVGKQGVSIASRWLA